MAENGREWERMEEGERQRGINKIKRKKRNYKERNRKREKKRYGNKEKWKEERAK